MRIVYNHIMYNICISYTGSDGDGNDGSRRVGAGTCRRSSRALFLERRFVRGRTGVAPAPASQHLAQDPHRLLQELEEEASMLFRRRQNLQEATVLHLEHIPRYGITAMMMITITTTTITTTTTTMLQIENIVMYHHCHCEYNFYLKRVEIEI